jgi:hypothetical protein
MAAKFIAQENWYPGAEIVQKDNLPEFMAAVQKYIEERIAKSEEVDMAIIVNLE